MDFDKVNMAAEFLPQRNEDEKPALRVGDALIFGYFDEDGTLCVTVDSEDVAGPLVVQVNVNYAQVYRESVG
jgi:hypothetical protein